MKSFKWSFQQKKVNPIPMTLVMKRLRSRRSQTEALEVSFDMEEELVVVVCVRTCMDQIDELGLVFFCFSCGYIGCVGFSAHQAPEQMSEVHTIQTAPGKVFIAP